MFDLITFAIRSSYIFLSFFIEFFII